MVDCRSRALYASAKWAASALCGLPEEEVLASSQAVAVGESGGSSGAAYELARSFFDLKVSTPGIQGCRQICCQQ